jgi:hypothetical protein
MPIVGTLLLFSVDRDSRAVHIQHYPLRCIHGLRLRQQFPIDSVQTLEVLVLAQHFGLEPMEARRQRRPTLPDFVGADQAEGRVLATGAQQQVRERQLRVLSPPTIHDVFEDKLNPKRSSNSRTKSRPLSEVTREPWNSTLKDGLNES